MVGIRAFDLDRALAVDPQLLTEDAHEHDASVTSVGIEVEGDLDEKRFQGWVRTLLVERGTDIFRMKGILAMRGQDEQFVFQGVHMLFDGAVGRPWGSAPRVNRLTFIGRNLDRDDLVGGFRRCLA